MAQPFNKGRPVVNGFESKAAAIRHLRAAGFNICTILGQPESNPKVAKNGKVVNVMTAPMHLVPFNLSGFQVCPKASKGCAAACLHYAGNPAYMEQKEKSRITKTRAYFLQRDAFMAVLVFEMLAHRRKWQSKGYDVAYRLNATSDLPWEYRNFTIDGVDEHFMDYFSDCEFYDYTAIPKRAINWAHGLMPKNYHLTFSRKEDNHDDVVEVLREGGNVAAVAEKSVYDQALADGFMDIDTIKTTLRVNVTDGDAHDYRPVDPKGCLVVLKAKGDAKRDHTGFVIRHPSQNLLLAAE